MTNCKVTNVCSHLEEHWCSARHSLGNAAVRDVSCGLCTPGCGLFLYGCCVLSGRMKSGNAGSLLTEHSAVFVVQSTNTLTGGRQWEGERCHWLLRLPSGRAWKSLEFFTLATWKTRLILTLRIVISYSAYQSGMQCLHVEENLLVVCREISIDF